MDSAYRQLSDRERGLLERLLEYAFCGRDELLSQLPSVTAKTIIDEDGTLSLRCSSGSPMPGKYRMVAEGECTDADGGTIAVLLHVNKDGFMSMLEILKYGPAPIMNPPTAEDLKSL